MRVGHGGVQQIATLIVLFGLNLLVGCQEAAPPVQVETSRPAEILTVSALGADSGLRFPGRVRAVQRAELAFNVPGQIVEFPAQPGDVLSEGALIARLDPAEYQSRLDAAQAEFDKARTDHERVRKIWEQSQAVARAEVDQKRTAMEVARSAYASARRDLEHTTLKAPFDGVIARRNVENFQNVQAKEPIVSLQNVEELEIVIHVPERVVGSEPRRSVAYAVFDVAPDRRVPVTVKSFATEADAQTQTYEVVLAITATGGPDHPAGNVGRGPSRSRGGWARCAPDPDSSEGGRGSSRRPTRGVGRRSRDIPCVAAANRTRLGAR
jgi:membrane fusion protein, multidrug efflux system